MKILCLFVRHGTTHYPEALAQLDQWYARHGLLDQRTLWIVDNALSPDQPPASLAPRALLRAGDNHAWEFSAWARALSEASAEGVVYDVVHCVTSAFNTLYTEYLNHFHREMLTYALAKNACLGHIDGYPQAIQLGAETSQSWIRTCFFFLPWHVARRLTPWSAHTDPTRIFSTPDSRRFRTDAPLSANYQANITTWLEGLDMGGHSWHSPVGDGPQEHTRFQAKALAILNEHSLALTLRRGKIPLVDFCWLHSLATMPSPSLPDPIPELDQLKIRRKVLGIPE